VVAVSLKKKKRDAGERTEGGRRGVGPGGGVVGAAGAGFFFF